MASNILPSGTSEAYSSAITLQDGEAATLIKRGEGQIEVQIEAASGWVTAGYLDDHEPVKIVNGPGAFRVFRQVCGKAVAVDRG